MFNHLIAKLKSELGQAATATDDDKSGAGSKDSGQSDKQKLEGLISDIDLSDVPENIREAVKGKLIEKVKSYDSGFRNKTQEITELKRKLEDREYSLRDLERLSQEIEGNPDMKQAISQVINDFRSGKTDTSSQKKVDKSLKKIDRLIDETKDAEQREQLKTMREIILEETGTSELINELKNVKEELASIKRVNNAGLSTGINAQIKSLEEKFGKEIVDKYRQNITSMANKYPEYLSNGKFSRILFSMAEESEIEEALVKSAGKKKEVLNRRKDNGTFAGGDSVVEKVDIPRDKVGRVDYKSWFGKMKSAGKF